MQAVQETGAGAETPRFYPLHFVEDGEGQSVPIGPVHIRSALARGLPQVSVGTPRLEKCVIVAGARSVLNYEKQLRKLYEEGHYFLAVNQIHNWLIEKGMRPHGQIVFEIGPIMDELQLNLQPETTYYVCSMCCPETFDVLAGQDVLIWHAWTKNPDHAKAVPDQSPIVGGGSTTLCRAIPLSMVLGFRSFEVFGGDSSFDGISHFNGIPGHLGEPMEILARSTNGDERRFVSSPYLIKQADDMREIFKRHHGLFRCRVHGDGLLPWMHKQMFPEQYQGEN